MSNPPDARIDPVSPALLLEQSLQVTCLRSGTNRALFDGLRIQQPYHVVGQCVDHGVIMRLDDHQPVHLKKGEGYFVPAGVNVHMRSLADEPGRFHWAHYRFTLLGQMDLMDYMRVGPHLNLAMASKVARLNQAMTRLAQGRHEAVIEQAIARREIATRMLALLMRLAQPVQSGGHDFHHTLRLHPAFTLMHDRMHEPVSRDDLARSCHLSPSRFHALFTQATGQSPLAYLARLRLRKAQQLLLTTDLSISQIGAQVGYTDAFHFSRTFRSHIGKSPRAYRDHSRQMSEHLSH